MNDELVVRCVVWEWCPQFDPGVATNRDGRLMVTDGKQTLILPPPATFIWEDAKARAAVRAIGVR